MLEHCGRPTRDEIRSRPELKDCETIFRKWKLLELSVVSIPGNANTLTTDVLRSGPRRWVSQERYRDDLIALIRSEGAAMFREINRATMRQAEYYGRMAAEIHAYLLEKQESR
jgi:hypothetical protein